MNDMNNIITVARLQGAMRSLTVWANGIILTAIPLYETFKDDFTQLQPYMTDANYRKLALCIVVGNIILRFKTTKDLANK